MEPKSFSASALHTAELCISRYHAENIERGRGESGTAAFLGTSVHGALEAYVKMVYLEKKTDPDLKLLLDLFKLSYMDTFETVEIDTEDFRDGVEMLKRWFKRDDLGQEGREVVSVEVKTNFPIKTTIGEIPFNYIWDRFDKIGPGVYKVVDYKTNRWGINPDDLKKKLQARCYALAAMIQLKAEGEQVDKVWVEFDMLRHDGPVGIVFSREENAATWRYLKELAQRVVDIKTEDARGMESLNAECNFCVRKTDCKAVVKNVMVGGIQRFTRAEETVDVRAQLEYQKKAVAKALEELDRFILTQAREEDVMEFESDLHTLQVTVSKTRTVDPYFVEKVIGPELFRKYGGQKFSIGNIDKLLKSDELTDEQKRQLVSVISIKQGEPRLRVEAKGLIPTV